MNNDSIYSMVFFREEQPMRQSWVWLIVLGLAGFAWYNVFSRWGLGRPLGPEPMPDGVLLVFWLLFGVGLPVGLYYTRLIIEVRADGLYFRYQPFHLAWQKILWAELGQYEAVVYRPLLEYGGWGIRYGRRGKAYSVSGSRGVQVTLVNGKRILFGSLRPTELAQAIEQAARK